MQILCLSNKTAVVIMFFRLFRFYMLDVQHLTCKHSATHTGKGNFDYYTHNTVASTLMAKGGIKANSELFDKYNKYSENITIRPISPYNFSRSY